MFIPNKNHVNPELKNGHAYMLVCDEVEGGCYQRGSVFVCGSVEIVWVGPNVVGHDHRNMLDRVGRNFQYREINLTEA